MNRRATDHADRSPVHVLQLIREWGPAVATVATVAWGQFARLEHDRAARREREEATADALTVVGRDRCSTLPATQSAAYGYPCAVILGGARWPLPRAAAVTTALTPAPTVPAPRPLSPAVLAAMLVPAAPSRSER